MPRCSALAQGQRQQHGLLNMHGVERQKVLQQELERDGHVDNLRCWAIVGVDNVTMMIFFSYPA
jgi:hypothetical protein